MPPPSTSTLHFSRRDSITPILDDTLEPDDRRKGTRGVLHCAIQVVPAPAEPRGVRDEEPGFRVAPPNASQGLPTNASQGLPHECKPRGQAEKTLQHYRNYKGGSTRRPHPKAESKLMDNGQPRGRPN